MPQTRISIRGHQTLRTLAKESGLSSEQVLDRALDLLDRQRILDQINAGYAALREKDDSWTEAEAERAAWDATLADGDT